MNIREIFDITGGGLGVKPDEGNEIKPFDPAFAGPYI